MYRYSKQVPPFTFFQPEFGSQLNLNPQNKIVVPYSGFRRMTSHLRPARQYPFLRSAALSDHAPLVLPFAMHNKHSKDPYLVPWSHYYKEYEKVSILSWNIMMRGRYNQEKSRYNNAFRINETEEEYLFRIERIVQNIGECVLRHPEIAMIFLQEAPVQQHHLALMKEWFAKYLPESFKSNSDATSWGILISASQQMFPQLEKLQTFYTGSLSDMNERKSTVLLPGLKTQLTNLHLPHDNPAEALNLIVNNLVGSLTFNIVEAKERYGSFIFIGDWNLAAKTIETAVSKAIEDLFHHKIPIRCDVTVVESSEGHIKTDGSLVAVDSSLVVSYKVSHRDLGLVTKLLASKLVPDCPLVNLSPRF